MEAHYSGTYTRLLVDHIRARLGEDGLTTVLERAGQPDRREVLADDATWSSYDEFRRFLEATEELLGEDAFARIPETIVLTEGQMAGSTDALVATGSANALIADLNSGNAGTTTIEDSYTTQVGPASWDLASRVREPFEPFAALCRFHVATISLIPRLFGCRNIEAEEISCQRDGDHWCIVRLSWEDGGDAQRADYLATRLDLAERRLTEFQQTVAEVVGTDDLEQILDRIVTTAASAVRAPGYVLTLDPLPWPARLLYAHGLPLEEAQAHADGTREGDMVVDIQSGRRHHGRLVAVDAEGVISQSMLGLLEGYAQLTATALDSAIAVEEARRQATTAHVLLELSVRLAKVTRLQELAKTLAQAIPGLVDCDRSVVALVDDLVATPVAVHGYHPEIEELVVGHPVLLPGPLGKDVAYVFPEDVDEATASFMHATGSLVSVMVPVFVDGNAVAWLSADVIRDPDRLRPSRELEERLHGLAAQAGTSLHNALLLEQVRYQADHDALTGLPNRKVLIDALVSPRPADDVTVLFVDLDDFKDVNDALGHHAGDLLLCEVANRLRLAVRDNDMVARLGGDEFAVLLHDSKPGVGQQLAERVIESFTEPFDVLGHSVTITASVGMARDAEPESLLRSADVAMYRAKAAGKGRMAAFEPGMDHSAAERIQLHADLSAAIRGGQLRLLFQPVLDLATGDLRSGEALVRWEHPELGLLTPDRFVGLAEDTGLIHDLGAWVLREACRAAMGWPDEVAVAVNLSPRQLDRAEIVDEIAAVLAESGLPAERLVLEITESVVARTPELMVPRLEALRALGLRIAVDDFGTGYSSLGSLVNLPVDILKIDRAFITRMLERPAASELVQVLIDMGRTLGLEVVAEGIERPEQADALRDQQCLLGQGYLYSRPISGNDFLGFVRRPVHNR